MNAASAAPNLHWTKIGAPDWATPEDKEAAKHYRALAIHIDSRPEAGEGVHWKHEALARVVHAAGVQVHSRHSAAGASDVGTL